MFCIIWRERTSMGLSTWGHVIFRVRIVSPNWQAWGIILLITTVDPRHLDSVHINTECVVGRSVSIDDNLGTDTP